MIALFDFVPQFCPNCGEPILRGDKRDYMTRCSHVCLDCGLHFQLAVRKHILVAASQSGGDLEKYA